MPRRDFSEYFRTTHLRLFFSFTFVCFACSDHRPSGARSRRRIQTHFISRVPAHQAPPTITQNVSQLPKERERCFKNRAINLPQKIALLTVKEEGAGFYTMFFVVVYKYIYIYIYVYINKYNYTHCLIYDYFLCCRAAVSSSPRRMIQRHGPECAHR